LGSTDLYLHDAGFPTVSKQKRCTRITPLYGVRFDQHIMRRSIFIFSLITALLSLQAGASETASIKQTQAKQTQDYWAMLERYCGDCHNTVDWAGSVAYDVMKPESMEEDAKIWESTIRKMKGNLMPPPGSKQLDSKTVEQFVHWVESKMDHATLTPKAGHVPVQRLNRVEYANSVRSLLGVEVKADELLPREIEVEGFANIAAALTTSPAFLDQYITAARTVAKLAVGDAKPKQANTYYPVPVAAQDNYIEGLPLGTRGGVLFRHNFPADGEYRLNVLDLDVGLYPSSVESRHTLVIFIDNQPVFRKEIGGPEDLALVDHKGADGRREIIDRFSNIPVQVKAGTREVAVTFVERAKTESDEAVIEAQFARLRMPRLVDGVQVVGPFGNTQLSLSASRAKIFVCVPKAVAEEPACARRIATNLVRRAYRREVTHQDIDTLMPFFDAGRKEIGNFDGGVRYLVTAMLSSPDFLYRSIKPASDAATTHALSDVELASRLSFFLWGEGPDDELLKLAIANKLSKPQVNNKTLEAQVSRMLNDPRASTLITSFAFEWLNLNSLDSVVPDAKIFPAYTPLLRQDFAREAELFIKSVLLGNQNVVTLMNGNYTYVNERLARHYGIQGVRGSQFRRVDLKDERRFGLLGKGAVLQRTSYGDRTSPILRGNFVLEKIMGTPSAPPPPGVNTDLSTPVGQRPKTLRAKLELHRTSKSCNQCHGVIDPIGLALENYDVTGEWREVDKLAGQPIDSSTTLSTGVPIKGPIELRNQLLKNPDQFVEAFTEKLLIYAINRKLEYQDYPQIRAIVRSAAKDDYRLRALVLGIANSSTFRLQSVPQSPAAKTQVAAVERTINQAN
jgi:mono/diheme cytochrome c family protein